MILEDLCKSQPEVLNCFDFLQPYNKLMKIFLLKGLNCIVLKVLGKIPLLLNSEFQGHRSQRYDFHVVDSH